MAPFGRHPSFPTRKGEIAMKPTVDARVRLRKRVEENAARHATVEDLILRLLGLLLDFGNFDPYWFCVSQGDLRPEDLLRGGQVYSSVVDAVIEELTAHAAAATGERARPQTAAPPTADVLPAKIGREVPK